MHLIITIKHETSGNALILLE